MNKKKRNIFILIVLLFFVVFLAWFFRPMSLYAVFQNAEGLEVRCTYHWMDGTIPQIDYKNINLSEEDERLQQIMSVLKKYKYRRSIRSLFENTYLADVGDYGIYLSDGENFIDLNGIEEVMINRRIYKIQGKENASLIMEELRAVLEE